MKQDIHKLAEWLETVCQDGVAVERKVLEWKLSQPKAPQAALKTKAS